MDSLSSNCINSAPKAISSDHDYEIIWIDGRIHDATNEAYIQAMVGLNYKIS